MHLRGTVVCRNRIHHHVPRIRYGTSLALYPTDTHSDRPVDLLAFSVIVFLAVRSNITKVPIPRLFKTIAQDATYYFLVIFTSHLVLVTFFWFMNVSISPQSSLFSLRLTQTPVARHRISPCQVGNTRTRFIRSLTGYLSAQ